MSGKYRCVLKLLREMNDSEGDLAHYPRCCVFCGTPFVGKLPKAMYCSGRCKARAQHAVNKLRGTGRYSSAALNELAA